MSESSDDTFEEGVDLEGFQAGLQTFGASLLAGVATLLVVTVVVTQLLADELDFSLVVGLPAGLVGGIIVGGVIYLAAKKRHAGPAQTAASLVMSFAAGFLIAYFIAMVVLDLEMTTALGAAAVVGLVLAVVSVVRNR